MKAVVHLKKRMVKKWINQYIKPMLSGLPSTAYRTNSIGLDDGSEIIVGTQHIYVNGYKTKEGELYRDANLFSSIQRTCKAIKELKEKYDFVFVRVYPEYKRSRLYVRLITESQL